jgi:hypothetical protein
MSEVPAIADAERTCRDFRVVPESDIRQGKPHRNGGGAKLTLPPPRAFSDSRARSSLCRHRVTKGCSTAWAISYFTKTDGGPG